MKRYLFYTADNYKDHALTGGNKRFIELLYSLTDNGDEVFLLAPEDINLPKKENLRILPVRTFQSKILPNGLLNLLLNRKAFNRAKKLNVDHTVLISFPYGIQGALIGLPDIALLLREDYFEYKKYNRTIKISLFKPVLNHYFKLLERFTLKKAGKIVVQCDYDKQAIISRHRKIQPSIEQKVSVLPNNVDSSWIRKHKAEKSGRNKEGSEMYNIAFVGNVDNYRKGLHVLLGAVERLLQKNHPVKLNVIGGGKLIEKYRQTCQNVKQIEFHGWQDEPMKHLAKQDLLVVPSLADSFPNTVLEGLYLEIPVIGSRRGGIPEILNYEELLFEPEENALFSRIAKMIDEHLFENYRQLCLQRKKALSFDWGEEMRKLLAE
ncbi:MAG: glycosyltransferase family 4 protein [Bacteroidota bacterium]